MKKCNAKTLKGFVCSRNIKNSDNYCHQHLLECNKPVECIVCYDSLINQSKPLECGHWIHTECIIQSAKAECPLCRTKLKLNKKLLQRIDKLNKKKREESLLEEETELRLNLQLEVANLIEPTLQTRVNIAINDIMLGMNENDIMELLDELFF